jgi:hypothetical protein
MRKLFSLLFTLMVNLLLGQKNDNYWPLAYSYGIGSVYYYNMEFTNGYADTVSYQRKMKFYMGNAAISDSSGDLQFYTNGIWIANRQHDTMQYSLNFNPSYSIGGGGGFQLYATGYHLSVWRWRQQVLFSA